MKELSLIETQIAIKFIKDKFEELLAKKLNLVRVSAPLFVKKSSGLNDELNGVEQRVSFEVNNETLEIVQSLAKWKRFALASYHFPPNMGLYTDMNAIRKDEVMDHLHSIYVDQWDWEKIILSEDRNKRYLFKIVNQIYQVMYKVSTLMEKHYGYKYDLPKKIYRISTNELLKRYPNKTNKEREDLITKEYKAVFIYEIGWPLKDKKPHDNRAADYDDWKLNGDIILFDEAINQYPISETMLEKFSQLDNFVIKKFKLAFGNRILKQLETFIPVYVACGGKEVDGYDFIFTNKVLKKFESLNIAFLKDELKELDAQLDKMYGKGNFKMAHSYIDNLIKNN